MRIYTYAYRGDYIPRINIYITKELSDKLKENQKECYEKRVKISSACQKCLMEELKNVE